MGPEQLKVLHLVAEGRISPAEGDRLLRILEAVTEVEPEVTEVAPEVNLEEADIQAAPEPAPVALPVEVTEERPPCPPKAGRVRQWLSALGIGQLQNR